MQTKTLSEKIAGLGIDDGNYGWRDCDDSKKALGIIKGLHAENQALLAKNELETRRAFIVANPCAQCGGKINAIKCEVWQARAEELEEKYAKLKKSFDEISHVKQVVFKLQNELEDKQEEIEELNKKLSGE